MTKKNFSLFRTLLALAGNQNGYLRAYGPRMLMEPEKGTGGGGGNGGGGSAPTLEDQLKAAQETITKLNAQLAENGKPKPKEEEEDDLRKKVQKEKEDDEKKKKETKSIEDVLRFNLSVDSYVKDNKDVLPEEFENILKMAEKETYDSAEDKAKAIKASFIQAFFSVQANVELLTTAQKAQLDDYLKLTKNGKEDAASQLYQNLFEPAIEMVKKLKKAEELKLARSGFHPGSKSEDAYKNKLIELGKKRFKIKE